MNLKNIIITITILLTIIICVNGDTQPYPYQSQKQQSTILQPKLTATSSAQEKKSQNELFVPAPLSKSTDIKYSQPLVNVNDNIYANHKNTPDTYAEYQTDTYNPYVNPYPPSAASSAIDSVQNINNNYDGRVNNNFDSSSSSSSLSSTYIPSNNGLLNGNDDNNNNNIQYELSPGNYDQQTAGSNQIRPYLQRQPYNDGYVVQTGYEGYYVPSLVPSQLAPPLQALPSSSSSTTSAVLSNIANLPIVGRIYSILKTILPISIVDFIMNSSGFVISMLTMILFGGALTTAVCTLTPICSISFAAASLPVLGLIGLRDTTKRITEKLGISSDSLDKITIFLQNAISKFDAMQEDGVAAGTGKEESAKNGKVDKVDKVKITSTDSDDKLTKNLENNTI